MNLEFEYYKVRDSIATFFGTKGGTELSELIKELARLKLMVCGGAINSIFSGASVNDLDFYMKDKSKQMEVDLFLRRYFTGDTYTTSNAITYRRPSEKSRKVWVSQLITRFVGDAAVIFDNFDFTITQGAFDFETDKFEFGDRFFPDLAKKRLVFLGKSMFPICAMYRTKKYQERGYKLPGSTIMHIALSIVRLEIKTYRDLKYQLMGIDTMYLQDMLNQEKYDDALPVDYGEFLEDAFKYIEGTLDESE
jgi:hypothetical protein